MEITVEVPSRSISHYKTMREWCVNQFGEPSNYADDTWNSREYVYGGYTLFFFERQKDASWFMLRWL
jgi:hypothetical protein